MTDNNDNNDDILDSFDADKYLENYKFPPFEGEYPEEGLDWLGTGGNLPTEENPPKTPTPLPPQLGGPTGYSPHAERDKFRTEEEIEHRRQIHLSILADRERQLQLQEQAQQLQDLPQPQGFNGEEQETPFIGYENSDFQPQQTQDIFQDLESQPQDDSQGWRPEQQQDQGFGGDLQQPYDLSRGYQPQGTGDYQQQPFDNSQGYQPQQQWQGEQQSQQQYQAPGGGYDPNAQQQQPSAHEIYPNQFENPFANPSQQYDQNPQTQYEQQMGGRPLGAPQAPTGVPAYPGGPRVMTGVGDPPPPRPVETPELWPKPTRIRPNALNYANRQLTIAEINSAPYYDDGPQFVDESDRKYKERRNHCENKLGLWIKPRHRVPDRPYGAPRQSEAENRQRSRDQNRFRSERKKKNEEHRWSMDTDEEYRRNWYEEKARRKAYNKGVLAQAYASRKEYLEGVNRQLTITNSNTADLRKRLALLPIPPLPEEPEDSDDDYFYDMRLDKKEKTITRIGPREIRDRREEGRVADRDAAKSQRPPEAPNWAISHLTGPLGDYRCIPCKEAKEYCGSNCGTKDQSRPASGLPCNRCIRRGMDQECILAPNETKYKWRARKVKEKPPRPPEASMRTRIAEEVYGRDDEEEDPEESPRGRAQGRARTSNKTNKGSHRARSASPIALPDDRQLRQCQRCEMWGHVCDRAKPCQRCIRDGFRDNCFYQSRVPPGYPEARNPKHRPRDELQQDPAGRPYRQRSPMRGTRERPVDLDTRSEPIPSWMRATPPEFDLIRMSEQGGMSAPAQQQQTQPQSYEETNRQIYEEAWRRGSNLAGNTGMDVNTPTQQASSYEFGQAPDNGFTTGPQTWSPQPAQPTQSPVFSNFGEGQDTSSAFTPGTSEDDTNIDFLLGTPSTTDDTTDYSNVNLEDAMVFDYEQFERDNAKPAQTATPGQTAALASQAWNPIPVPSPVRDANTNFGQVYVAPIQGETELERGTRILQEQARLASQAGGTAEQSLNFFAGGLAAASQNTFMGYNDPYQAQNQDTYMQGSTLDAPAPSQNTGGQRRPSAIRRPPRDPNTVMQRVDHSLPHPRPDTSIQSPPERLTFSFVEGQQHTNQLGRDADDYWGKWRSYDYATAIRFARGGRCDEDEGRWKPGAPPLREGGWPKCRKLTPRSCLEHAGNYGICQECHDDQDRLRAKANEEIEKAKGKICMKCAVQIFNKQGVNESGACLCKRHLESAWQCHFHVDAMTTKIADLARQVEFQEKKKGNWGTWCLSCSKTLDSVGSTEPHALVESSWACKSCREFVVQTDPSNDGLF